MRIIPLAGEAEPMLSPDLVWDGIMGDLALAEPSEVQNRGGLRARAQLETAVLICLMSDARAAAEELRDGDTNRGWPGDTFDLDTAAGEAPIGSRLWLLERSTVDAVETPRRAEDYARAALQPLLDQGAAAGVTARAEADPARNRLTLAVTLTDRAGGLLVSRRFSLLWERLAGISVPYAPVAPEEDSMEPLPPVAPPLFGASLPAGVLLGDEPDGFALDFTRNSGLIRSSSDKSLQKSGTIADLCTFTRATAATYFDRNGILRTAGPNVLRLTHDPVTGEALGALLEGSATQLFAYPKGNGGFGSTPVYTANALMAPDGTLGATRIDNVGGEDTRRYQHDVAGGAFTSGQVLTIQWHQKRLNYTGNGWSSAPGSFFAIKTLVNASYVDASCKKVSDLPGGWEHWTAQVTITDGAAASTIRMYFGGTTFLPASLVTDLQPFAFWGINIVAAPFRSSIIMQQGTRLADNLSYAMAGPPEGTVVVRGRTAKGAGTQTLLQWDDGTNNNRLIVSRSSTRAVECFAIVGGTQAVRLNMGNRADDTDISVAFSWRQGRFAASLDGAAAVTDTSYTDPLPIVSRFCTGHRGSGSFAAGGTIASVRLLPKSYDPADLEGMSTL